MVRIDDFEWHAASSNAQTAVGASFAEHFYGLQRRRRPLVETERANIAVGRATEPVKLRDLDVGRSLLFLVSDCNHY